MKLVTFRRADGTTFAGVMLNEQALASVSYPDLLELLRDPAGLERAAEARERGKATDQLDAVQLLAPVPEPPTLRDFYAFEQHVKAARAKRGLGMIPEWYEIPTFYFSNTSEIYGPESVVPYPRGSQELDFELEIACVIGKEGKDIPVEDAAQYIAGYTIMNDWSARDFQRKDMKLNLGPGKGKDFATSLGPFLVTPDELETRRTGSGASERYDMPMITRINGREISRGNFKDIHFSFAQMIAYASRNTRLRIGDVLGSGTVGTGCILELGTEVHRWLQPGDLVEMEIEGIGVLRNTVG
ncbi:fumarylacetoacetate (FAA) hydrolase [Thermosporothrix hazakensis]|jgi:fumarylacetoacetate (FAA) hydrolase|uniref:Fumarylacetoacetate (FAA) hydrolase n=2 Tax=Thermosporothrix TaxID=768650 RepID=A0A326U3A4_THEHA|nr:fumarylacetoacetate hydrolase family protein [Thermosporothrix hazakensis]PZW26403.1 fumarylacetoacetate (FAA) hydrolase [Thermosporothrix hazakensis]BBH90595.1 fumarylacetoacetase [Thermosporothrix sp. COM3]GCE48646.1 fumarylacetoacetase [Thermosporothrix hazakensis]